jgi:hypothetical protein
LPAPSALPHWDNRRAMLGRPDPAACPSRIAQGFHKWCSDPLVRGLWTVRRARTCPDLGRARPCGGAIIVPAPRRRAAAPALLPHPQRVGEELTHCHRRLLSRSCSQTRIAFDVQDCARARIAFGLRYVWRFPHSRAAPARPAVECSPRTRQFEAPGVEEADDLGHQMQTGLPPS